MPNPGARPRSRSNILTEGHMCKICRQDVKTRSQKTKARIETMRLELGFKKQGLENGYQETRSGPETRNQDRNR